MTGEEPRPSDPTLQEDWDERASAGYYLMSQSLELNQRHNVMHLLLEVDCAPKAWTVLKELHAPTSIVATLMQERELSTLRLSEGEPWVRTKIPEEDFRRRQLRGGDDGSGGYGMQGSRRGRGRGFGGAGRGAKKDDDSNDQQGGTGWGCGAISGCGGKSGAGGKMKGSCWNRVLSKVGNESWVPLERWLGRKPPVDMLRVFGCMAVAHVPKKYRSKLGASAIWCVHLGLAAESKGWLLWEPSKGVLFNSRDVKFVEGMMFRGWKKQPETKGGDGEKVQEAPAGGGDDVEASGSTSGAAGPEGEQQQGKAKAPTLPQRRKAKGVVMKGWETPVSRPGRTRMATMKLTAGADVTEQQLGNEEALLILPHGYDPDKEDEPAYCFHAPAPEEPASMEEALAGPDRENWLVSRDAEYQSLLENGTCDLVVLPEGKKAVQCKWVLRIKTDDKGQVTIYKSRLVAKGFMQKEKQDFNEIFAPTAKPPTLRNRHQDGGARRNQKNGANMVVDSSDNNPKSNGGAEKKKERTAGQFFHIGEQGEQGDASAKVRAERHPLDYWVLDTGAAWTMTPRKELLDDVRAAPINEVCSASGHALKVAGAGRAAFKRADGKPVVLHDVFLVPDLKANLISLRKLAKAGVSTSTDGARTYKGQLGNRVLWDLHESKDVYRSMWQLPALAWHSGGQAGEGSASQGECNAVGGVGVKVSARSGETDWATAHRRLGHVAMPLLKQLEKDGAVKGLKLNGQLPDDNCDICLLSKFTRFPFHSVTGRSKKLLELVHMDLVGPLPVQGHKGERYFLTIVDDWSRIMWAYPLKQKDHAASTIKKDWLPFFEKQAECVVKRIRTDRGGEFLGAETTAWLKKQGIQRELTTAYTPQSNGVAERVNRTILETARALLIESGVVNSMWPHAVRHATVARNRVLTKVGNEWWVPLERWLGRKLPVDMLRVFGCMAVAHVPKKYRSKLGASAIWCVHLGLAAESKGWLLWEPSKGVLFDSRDVKFVEGMMYGGWKKQPETKVSQQMEQITMQLDLTPSVWEMGEEAAAEGGDGEKVQEASGSGGDDVETSGSTQEAAGSEGGEKQLGKARVPARPSRRKPKGVVMRGWETPVSRPGRTRMATMKLTAGADVAEQQLGNEEALLILPHGYDPDEEDEPAYCFLAPAPEEPASVEEALAGPDREKWLVSRDAEYQSLLENGTWDLVVLPEGKKAVQCKWVLRIKTDDKGQVTIYKSRLVAKGFMQKEKQDFNEIFAPTAKPPTLREDVYMTQPPGYEDGTGRVCKLKNSIYGLKKAPRCWYQKLAAVLEEMGFRTSSCDESLFLKGEGEKLVLFLVYMDDILLFSSSMKEIQNVQQQLMKNFKWLKLHQEKFIKELGEKYGIENERKVATPLPAEFKLVKAAEDEGVEAEEQQKFQSLVGSLLYAAVHTRPDISFSVGQLARVVQNPSEEQVDAAEHVVKYLNSHPSIGVQYSASAQVKQKGVEVLKEKGERLGEGKLFLTCFTDATSASEKDDSSSVGGYICVVGGGPVSWRSKKQTETALSSVESEYMEWGTL
ncbi:unnamed protein product [Closterium sp. NIES-53]